MAETKRTATKRQNLAQRLSRGVTEPFRRLRRNRDEAVHKSFALTRRRDLPTKPKLENIFHFSAEVWKTLWEERGLFARFVVVFMVVALLLAGLVQSENISSINETVDSINAESTVVGPLLRAAMITSTSLTTTLSGGSLSDIQQFYMSALYILACLVVIWLLRQRLAGNAVKLRDGLYSAGAPLISILILLLIGIAQLLPFALGVLLFAAAQTSGLLSGGIVEALFAVALFLGAVLSAYFVLTTLFALMVATIPGTYPVRAYKTARQIIVGQRLRLLMRLLWLALMLVVAWYVILVPVAIIANALSANVAAIVAFFSYIMLGFSLAYGSAYCYLLYRRMIDDPVAA